MIFCHFTKTDIFCDFLFAPVHDKASETGAPYWQSKIENGSISFPRKKTHPLEVGVIKYTNHKKESTQTKLKPRQLT